MKEILLHVIEHSILDSIKLLPFLFIAFFIIEFIEHKYSKRINEFVSESGKYGHVIGSLLGLIPQCGFSVMATNFYITRVISLGTLFSIYLATSDEMLPIMISNGASLKIVISILIIKFISGFTFGYIIDFLFSKNKTNLNYDLCNDEHCDCEHGLLKSSVKHTLSSFVYIFIITLIVTFIFEYFGENMISKIFMKNSIFGPILGSLVGLIPNCGASIALSELYLNNAISFGTCVAGLLTGSGVAILVLFRANKNFKENLFILTTLYLIGVLVGIFIEFLGILI